MGLKVIILILFVVHCGVTVSLECYKCTAVLDLAVCDITQRCYDGQVCFHNSTISDEIQVTSLGCTASQQCGVQNNIQSSVGMDIITKASCVECCSTDKCNKHLCQHLKPSACTDDESVDCEKLNTFFSICNDISKAKILCPKFCGICYVVDGNWSNWSKWSQCDVTCANGTQTRTRLCNNPSPKNGGNECLGNRISTQSCSMELCPLDGGWSPWEAWVSCSTSCDIGLQSRKRNCSNPIPERKGQHCFGNNFDVRLCMPGTCADGGWSDWGGWNSCSVTCGVGVRTKSRSCTKPPPSPFGQFCIGEHFQIESCTMPECATSACKSRPCVHGKCFDGERGYVCVCDVGYRGKQCSISMNYCLSSPCIRGTCINSEKNFTCVCPPGVTGIICETIPASDCYDILKQNLGSRSGIYWVQLWKTHEYIEALCDLETAGGGWTVFQRRFNGSVDFARNFFNYTHGFGNKNGEFWLGLYNIYKMTSQGRSELRLDLMSADQTEVYEVFPDFYLSSGPSYTLHIGRGIGTAGDSDGLTWHNGHNFYTYDHDDSHSCSSIRGRGGWWYHHCVKVNLNGQYETPGFADGKRSGIMYYDFQRAKSLKYTRMMFRRTSN